MSQKAIPPTSPFFDALTAFTGPAKPTTPTVTAYKPYVPPPYPHVHLPLLTDLDVPSTMLMQTLHRALRVKRADGSASEARFVAWLANRLPVTMIDAAGNIHVDTRKGPQHRTMFTSHTDTVHHTGGENLIRLDATDPDSVKWRADKGACLGADDGAGIALMMHMLDNTIPGYYIFFRGEECGGVGSSWLAQHMPQLLKEVDRCISFDRADYMDVITHQAGGRCCSDEFAKALADALTTEDMTLAFTPDDTGVFTDSANLTELISECTNLSVGYKHQHGDGEWQDVSFLVRLADQLCLVPWEDLPVKRDPLVVEDYASAWMGKYGAFSTHATGNAKYVNAYLDRNNVDKEILLEALWDAYAGSYTNIKQLVAEFAMPEDPDSAYPFVNPFAVKPEKYEEYADKLDNGTLDYDALLDILYDVMVVN